jgi:hypothetical protein
MKTPPAKDKKLVGNKKKIGEAVVNISAMICSRRERRS